MAGSLGNASLRLNCRVVAIHAPASNCGVTRMTVLALAEGYQPCVCVAPRGIVEISQ